MDDITTIIEEMISIVEIEGEDALTDDRIEKCCKDHNINTEKFKDLFANSIPAINELTSESLNKVFGGSRSGLRKAAAIAALLNVQNIIGASAANNQLANDQLKTKTTASQPSWQKHIVKYQTQKSLQKTIAKIKRGINFSGLLAAQLNAKLNMVAPMTKTTSRFEINY